MIKKAVLGIIVIAYLVLIINQTFAVAGGLNCTIATSCPTNFTKLLGLENDTQGFQNAHVQNRTVGTYNYDLCCQATAEDKNVTTECEIVFLRLSADTNAHVQQEQVGTYTIDACMNSTKGTPSCSYVDGTCPGSQECLLSMENSEGSNTTNAHVGNCTKYATKLCCAMNNTAPSKVTLISPPNESTTTNRTPFFNWTAATDPDNDPITYRIQVATDDAFTVIVIDTETSETNYTALAELDFDDFYWRVYSNDTDAWNVSDTWNFTVITSIILTLVNDSVNFNYSSPNQQNGTEDDSPRPFHLRNDGNVEVTVSINASELFDTVGLNNPAYRYKADNASESDGAFNWSDSTTTYANMLTSATSFLVVFNHTDTNDEAEIDIQITVPNDEPAGEKNSTVEFTGELP